MIRISALNAGHINGIRAFRGIALFERHPVAGSQVIEIDILELILMEEQVFVFAVDGNESEPFIRDVFNYSLHCCEIIFIDFLFKPSP